MFLFIRNQIDINHDHEEFIKLPVNVSDVDFSRCFLREHGKYVASVSPCSVEDFNNVLICSYNSHVVSTREIVFLNGKLIDQSIKKLTNYDFFFV